MILKAIQRLDKNLKLKRRKIILRANMEDLSIDITYGGINTKKKHTEI